jgi:CRP-like cAMP-binding protein
MDPVEFLREKIEAYNLWDEEIHLKRNDFLKFGNITDSNVYYITEGCISIYILDSNGEEQDIRFGYRESFVAALDSFISEKPSDMYMQALRKTKIKAIRKSTFMKFLDMDNSYRLIWYSILEQLILQCLERERDLLAITPMERYQRVFKRSPQLFQEVPLKYIASYLRMAPETLSRLRNS